MADNVKSTQGHENEKINVAGLKAALQKFKTSHVDTNTQAIATEKTRAEGVEQTLQLAIDIINGKIPTQATAQNQLADKEFVNSSISTATADFKGTYNSLEDLEQVTANANDYAFVIAADAAGNTLYKRYKWVDGTGWVWEYDLNNSSFTAAQWAAIQSGITAALVTKLSELPTNAELNQRITQAIASALTAYYTKTEIDAALAGKQDVIQDLSAIRSGASAGATAVQPETLNSALSAIVAGSGVYDVTVNNDNTKFASLSALLSSENLDTLIPSAKRKGGMSIKFVQSSDNKYVQYRLLTEEFSTNVEDWEDESVEVQFHVIAEALIHLHSENKALRELLTGKNNAVLPYIKAQTIEFENLMSMDVPNILESEVAGAPSAANVPKNWNNDTMGVWDGCPRKVGQQYVDKKSKKVYYAVSVTGSTADWVLLN